MNIAIVGRYRDKSSNGVDRTISAHIIYFAESGHKVSLITHERPCSQDKIILDLHDVEIIYIPKSHAGTWILLSQMRNHFDAVWLHSVFTFRNWVAQLALKCPTIVTPNGGYSEGQIRYKSHIKKIFALWIYERRMLESALFIQCLSNNEANQVGSIAPKANVFIAPNGTKEPLVTKSRQFNSISKRILYIGRLSCMHKGLDLLIRALGEITEDETWSLDLVGPGTDSEIEFLSELCNEHIISHRVTFHGPLYGKDKLQILSEASIFIHTSRWEGMPFAVIEALADGLPVIVTAGTNMADLVKGHDAGWVCESDEISSTISRALACSSSVLGRKSRNARHLVQAELEWRSITSKLLNNLHEKLPEHADKPKKPPT